MGKRGKIHLISAATGKGVHRLLTDVVNRLDEIRNHAAPAII